MVKKIILAAIALFWIAGQVVMASGKGSVQAAIWLSAGCVAAAAAALFYTRERAKTALAFLLPALSLALAICGQAVVTRHPYYALALFAASAAALLFAPREKALFDAATLSGNRPASAGKWEFVFIALLLVYAYFTRFASLSDLPSGAVEHEGRMALWAKYLSEGRNFTPYITDTHANWSSLLFYQMMTAMKLHGWGLASFRFFPALYGTISLIVFYFTARRITKPLSAALATALFAASAVHMGISRQIFTGSMLFFPALLGFAFIMDGIRRRKWFYFAAAGAAAAFSLHGYFPGRTIPFLFLAWMAYDALFSGKERIGLKNAAVFWGAFYLTAAPVINFAITNPQDFSSYVGQMSGGLYGNNPAGMVANFFRIVIQTFPKNIALYYNHSDWDYNLHVAFEPLLEPAAGAAFAVGAFILLARVFKPVPMFLFLAFFASIMPSVMANGELMTRRSIMALPIIYMIAAVAIEYWRSAFTARGGRAAGYAVAAGALLVGGLSMYDGYDKYMVKFVNDPGTRVPFNHNMYLAGKQMEKYPRAVVSVYQTVETTALSSMAIYRPGPPVLNMINDYQLFTARPGRDALFLMPPFEEGVQDFVKKIYPDAVMEFFRESRPDAPFYTDTLFRADPWTAYIDPYNPKTFLLSVLVPAKDIDAFHSSLWDASQDRPVAAFGADFGAQYAGRRMTLTAMFIAEKDGALVTVNPGWPGWQVRVDGSVTGGRVLNLGEGIHYLELSGTVPAGSKGPFPLKITSDGKELVSAGLTGAYPRPYGFKVSYYDGERSWGTGRMSGVRYEPFDVKRFYWKDPSPVPFSAEFSGYISVPETGAYYFTMKPFMRGRIVIDGKPVFDALDIPDAANAQPQPVILKKGARTAFKAQVMVGPARLGANTMVVYVANLPGQKPEIMPVEWTQPY